MKILGTLTRLSGIALAVCMIWHVACFGGGADIQASLPSADGDLRSMTGGIGGNGSISASPSKSRALATADCPSAAICCYNEEGEVSVASLDESCAFSISMPTNNIYYCGIFDGDDEDNNNCPDNYLSSVGCSESGFAGEIPYFADADGGYDDISLGTASLAGRRFMTSSDACAQIDQDGDGTTNNSDTDDDGDGTNDDADNQEGSLARGDADDLDSNGDGIPDIFQSIWGDLDDADNDGIPDYFDVDWSCDDVESDTNGDCIPDSLDICAYDGDGDNFNWCLDCDDADASTTTSCYYNEESFGFDFCAIDNDEDGLDICRDCDDEEDDITTQCFSGDFGNLCDSTDTDGDGFNFCYDCDDYDTASTFECYDTTTDWCAQDLDSDGVNVCLDCEEGNASVTTECYGDYAFCEEDNDGDGTGYCEDCDDQDATVTNDCSSQDYDGDGISFANDCNDFDEEIVSSYSDDADGDGYGACYDCNDNDAASTYECFGSYDYCSEDNDGDGIGYCDDCNDYDSSKTATQSTDIDADGYNACFDCDDNDASLNYTCDEVAAEFNTSCAEWLDNSYVVFSPGNDCLTFQDNISEDCMSCLLDCMDGATSSSNFYGCYYSSGDCYSTCDDAAYTL